MQTFSEYLESLIKQFGSQMALAMAAGIEQASISRFRSDQNGLSRDAVDRLLAVGKAIIVTEDEIRSFEDTLDHMATMWRRERRKRKEDDQCRKTDQS